MSSKKVVLLAGKGISTNMVYHALKDKFDVVAVVIEQKESAWLFVKRRANKLGWGTAIGQVLFQILIVKPLHFFSASREREVLEINGLNKSEIEPSVIQNVSSVNSKQCITLLQQIAPDVIVVNGTRIISKKVLQSVHCKFINMHAGITPAYRGVHGGYWALVNNDQVNCGVTVHLVDSGVDTGNVLYQERITATAKDNFTTYPLLQLAAGLPRLKEAINDVLKNELKPITATSTNSQQWYHPTIWQYMWYWLAKGVK